MALPVPDNADVIASQEALLEAVHDASGGVMVSDVAPIPPFGLKVADGGFNDTLVPAPAWDIENVCPPMVNDPERWLDELFAATAYPTVPLPTPGAPEVTESHPVLLVAVQLASDGVAVTDTVPVVAEAPTVVEPGFSETDGTAPAWVIEKTWPPIVIVPNRAFTEFVAVTE